MSDPGAAVIFRKICFGSRSFTGADALAVNLSLLISATRQHKNPIDLFANILLHGSDLPTTSIYTTSVAAESNDSS